MFIWQNLQMAILFVAASKVIEKLIKLLGKKSEVTIKWFA